MRSFGKLAFIGTLVLTMVLIAACDSGKSGSPYDNSLPTVRITSFNGDSLSTGQNPDTLASNVVLFQQKVYWTGEDKDGIVTGYAFRILNNDWDPIATPGYEVIDEDGWVYHYKDGANENIPLEGDELSENVRTIWSDQVYATINFPASNAEHDSVNVPSILEVKCIDDRGGVSEVTRKFFLTYSVRPVVTISSSKGDLDDKTTGTGIRFVFNMKDDDPYATTEPWYFEYKLQRFIPATGAIEYESEWISTKDNEINNKVVLTGRTSPALVTNFNSVTDTTAISKTRMLCRGYDWAGIVSKVDTVDFWVKEGFSPGTLIYDYDIYALGSNHFVTYQDASLNIVIPSQETTEGTIYSTPFFKDVNDRYVALWSNDIRAYMSWGFHGEYTGDNPRDKKMSYVYDETSNTNYMCEIQAFDLRLDGEPYNYPPYEGLTQYQHTDEDGTQWLRVPISSDISQKTVLNNLAATDPYDVNSYHWLEVRAVDLQGVGDTTPARYEFKLDAIVEPQDKAGILVIDDEAPDPAGAPEPGVTNFFNDVLSDFATVDVLNRKDISDTIWDNNLHYGWDVFSPTDLQRYKCVIWHSENPSASSKHNFYKEYDVFNLYLRHGGNVIITGGANVADSFNGCKNNAFPLISSYFGVSTSILDESASITPFGGSVIEHTIFLGAHQQLSGWSDVMVNLTDPFQGVGPLLIARGGMGAIAYMNPDNFASGVETLYRTIIKEPGTDNYSPSQAEYDACNDQVCAIRYKRTTVEYPSEYQMNYIFTFPLSYCYPDQVKAMLNKAIGDIMAL